MLHAILSTLVVLVPVLCMITLIAVAYEAEGQEPSAGYRIEREGRNWVLYSMDSAKPIISDRRKHVVEDVLDLLDR